MQPIRYIIVDDEPLARQALIKLLANIQEMQLVAECSNAAEALIILKAGNTDLLFLDINMPEITGLQLLKSLNKAPKV
ncbi:MAG TPA: response regulator, partial [Chitinophagaceae bacterium]|nr:response regulator [Chitinophagaceae bacterium]